MTKIKNVWKPISILKYGNTIYTKSGEIFWHAVDYFTDSFSFEDGSHYFSIVEEVIPSLVTGNMNNLFSMLLSMKEIQTAVFDLNVDSAPGPEGFRAYFFQIY